MNRLRCGGIDLPLDGAPDTLRAGYDDPNDDGHIHAMVGDSLIMLIEWGKAGSVHLENIHQLGAATLDSASPHYAAPARLLAERC